MVTFQPLSEALSALQEKFKVSRVLRKVYENNIEEIMSPQKWVHKLNLLLNMIWKYIETMKNDSTVATPPPPNMIIIKSIIEIEMKLSSKQKGEISIKSFLLCEIKMWKELVLKGIFIFSQLQ